MQTTKTTICPVCRGSGKVKQVSTDKKSKVLRCQRCRGTGISSNYSTK